MVELASCEASDEAWEKLRPRAVKCLTGQDLIEFWELRGRAARRRRADDELARLKLDVVVGHG